MGGLLEDVVRADASVGSTFACLIATEFRNKRFADRFWHERPEQFSIGKSADLWIIYFLIALSLELLLTDQLNYLRRITMSQIICMTTGLRHVASQSFLVVSDK